MYNNQELIEINKELIGKNVWVWNQNTNYIGEVIKVKNWEIFLVRDMAGAVREVNIHHIRSIDDERK